MLLNLKATILLSLLATSFALPTADPEAVHLQVRAKIPDKITCNGVEFTVRLSPSKQPSKQPY